MCDSGQTSGDIARGGFPADAFSFDAIGPKEKAWRKENAVSVGYAPTPRSLFWKKARQKTKIVGRLPAVLLQLLRVLSKTHCEAIKAPNEVEERDLVRGFLCLKVLGRGVEKPFYK